LGTTAVGAIAVDAEGRAPAPSRPGRPVADLFARKRAEAALLVLYGKKNGGGQP
jgi:hypothetical protein